MSLTKKQIISSFADPSVLMKVELETLEGLVSEYPFSGVARMLFLKRLQLADDIRFEKQLEATAVHVPSRKRLHEWLKHESTSVESISEVQASEVVEALERSDEAVPLTSTDDAFSSSSVDELQQLQDQYLTEAIQTSIGMEVEEEVVSRAEEKVLEQEIEQESLSISKDTPSDFLDFISGESTGMEVKGSGDMEAVIDRFIQKEAVEKVEFFDPERMARASLVDDGALVTDTLARVYMEQGNYEKALRAYETLSLSHPEKRVYFAGRIQKVNDLIQKRKKK